MLKAYRVLGVAIGAAISLSVAGLAWAQTTALPPPPNAPQQAAPAPAAPTVTMPVPTPGATETTVNTVENLELAEPNPASVTAKLSPQITSKIGKGGDTVRLVGTARGVKSGAGSQSTIGQMVWNGVQAEVNGRKRQVPLDKPLTSSFVARATAVPPGTAVKATGDIEGLVSAARKLFDVPAEETRKAENDKQKKPQTNAVGGGGSSNDVAQAYQPMAPLPAKAETPELPTVTGFTKDGCVPRVDEAQGVVIVQSRTTTSQGGVITSEGACTDSEVRYLIQNSYASCTDRVDVPALKAFAQYRKYYTDDQGRTSFLNDCVDDPNNEFALTEEVASCTYDVDLDAMLAYQRAELVYVNRQNQRVLVEACRRTAAAGLPVSKTAAGCAFRHDFAEHISYQQKKFVYTNASNAVTTVAECSDDETETYTHVDVRNVCANLVDQTGMKAFPQRRWQIVPPAGALWISECEPATDEGTDIVATVNGCESIYYHYLASGQSFGANRHYYSFDGGASRTYINSCQQSTTAYPHKSEVQGYEYHDPEKYGFAKTAIYIDAMIGRVDVSAAQVREGAPQLAYIFVRQTMAAQPDKKYWEGCNAYTPTALTDIYKRPDNTEVGYAIGPGTPTGPVDECSRVTQNQTIYTQTKVNYNQWAPNTQVCGSSCVSVGFATTMNLGSNWASFTSCAIGAGWSASFSHMLQPQNRIATTYPNGGGTTYSAWANVGGEQVASTFSCTGAPDNGGGS